MNDITVPPAPPAPRSPAISSAHAALIERWWADHFPGSPVAAVTAAWNHAFAAKEALKRLFAEPQAARPTEEN